MDSQVDPWKEDLEAERSRLSDIRTMTTETKEKIKRMEDEHNEQRTLYQKKLRTSRKVQSIQEDRLNKLVSDIKLLSNLSAGRREELNNLIKVNKECLAELAKTKEDAETSIAELNKRIQDLVSTVKQSYQDLQNEKEIQVLMEVGLSNVKDDGRLPISTLETIVRKRQESVKQRREEINKEISKIEQEQANVEEEIKQKQDKLAALKDTYLDLVRFYKKEQKAK